MCFELEPSLVPSDIQLRQRDASDLGFLRALYRTVRDPELAQMPDRKSVV